jgi:GH25 family lysozyme M1 (1,4-beta-N-acetylmuramidase)
VLTKSKGVLVASALALAAAGGSVAFMRAESTGSVNAASAARPMPVGSAVTATVPSRAAVGADGIGSGLAGSPSGSAGPASGGSRSGGTASSGTASGGAASVREAPASGARGTAVGRAASDRSPVDSMLPMSAGQGEPGPLPPGTLPADGAVPGASPAVHALAAARRAITALPHSPRLLAQLAGAGGWTGSAVSAATTATAQATTTGAAPLAGLDVASHQHPVTSQYPHGTPINWRQVAAAHYRFAAIKGTEGNYYVNPWAATDLAEAKAAGLDVSPYHFAIPNVSSGPEQAKYAVEYSGYAPGAQTLPLMLDIEYDPYAASDGTNECYGLSHAQMTAWIAGFVTTARSLTGQYPIIYTTANWWDACTGGSIAFVADPMWVAAYAISSPPLPAGWTTYSYWQYTSVGTVPGVATPGGTDLDSFSPSAVALIDPGPLAGRPLTRVSFPLSSLGGLAGETLTWTASGLPPGLRITALGVLSGVIMNPSSAAKLGPVTYRPTVTAENTAGGSSSVTFGWQIADTCPGHLSFGVCPGR